MSRVFFVCEMTCQNVRLFLFYTFSRFYNINVDRKSVIQVKVKKNTILKTNFKGIDIALLQTR